MARKPSRTIRLEQVPDDRGVGAFLITMGKKSHHYTFREIPSEIGGRAFVIHKMGVNPPYCVRIHEPRDSTCECLGFYRHNHCKHIAGLAALIRAKKI